MHLNNQLKRFHVFEINFIFYLKVDERFKIVS